MGSLEHDTRVEGGGGRYIANVSDAWEIWGPMGGYVASIALRAAAAEVSGDFRPASFTCQFFSPAKFAPVALDVTVRRASRRTAAVSVALTQDGTAILDAQAWFAAEVDVVEHDHAPKHAYAHPDQLRYISELTDEQPRYRFWTNFESKPVAWVEDWENRPVGKPEWAEWLRFVPEPAFADPVVEACRLLLLTDLPSFPAASRTHPPDEVGWVTPSLDLAVQFHRLADLGEWLLCIGTAPIADCGFVAFRSEVWTTDGRLVASGSGQLLARNVS